MAQFIFESPGVLASDEGSVKVPRSIFSGVPAAVIGTSRRGPAFVPVSVGSFIDFINYFDFPSVSGSFIQDRFTDYGPLAVSEWLLNSNAAI